MFFQCKCASRTRSGEERMDCEIGCFRIRLAGRKHAGCPSDAVRADTLLLSRKDELNRRSSSDAMLEDVAAISKAQKMGWERYPHCHSPSPPPRGGQLVVALCLALAEKRS
jgi:hypothetical protein